MNMTLYLGLGLCFITACQTQNLVRVVPSAHPMSSAPSPSTDPLPSETPGPLRTPEPSAPPLIQRYLTEAEHRARELIDTGRNILPWPPETATFYPVPSPYPLETLPPSETMPGNGGISDLAIVEAATLQGQIYDDAGQLIPHGAVRVRSLIENFPYRDGFIPLQNGHYESPHIPLRHPFEVYAHLEGYSPRLQRVIFSHSNKAGDPKVNRVDFGSADLTDFLAQRNALSRKPEINTVWHLQDENGALLGIGLHFSKAVNPDFSVGFFLESASKGFVSKDFDWHWNRDQSAVEIRFRSGAQQHADLGKWQMGFLTNTLLQSQDGYQRQGALFKLGDADFQSQLAGEQIMKQAAEARLMSPLPSPWPIPQITPEPSARPSPWPIYSPLPSRVTGQEHVSWKVEAQALSSTQLIWQDQLKQGEFPSALSQGEMGTLLQLAPFQDLSLSKLGPLQYQIGNFRRSERNPYLETHEIGMWVKFAPEQTPEELYVSIQYPNWLHRHVWTPKSIRPQSLGAFFVWLPLIANQGEVKWSERLQIKIRYREKGQSHFQEQVLDHSLQELTQRRHLNLEIAHLVGHTEAMLRQKQLAEEILTLTSWFFNELAP